jgi:glyoxylase-like metal-dependent hydrolase (beta-lactamase superfamily II)
MKLLPGVYRLSVGAGLFNAYLLQHEATLTLVDAGYGPGFRRVLEAGLAALGKTYADLRHIFITHAHPDHVGALALIQQLAPHATTYIHELDAPVLRGEQPFSLADPQSLHLSWAEQWLIRRLSAQWADSLRVDVVVTDGQLLPDIYPQAQVIHLPGHSVGQCGLWLPRPRILLGGDVLMNLWGLQLPLRLFSADWMATQAAIGVVAQLEVHHLLLGHGRPLLDIAYQSVNHLWRQITIKELAPIITELHELSDSQLRYLVQAIQQLLHQRTLPVGAGSTLEQAYERGKLPGESLEQFLARIAPSECAGFWS